MSSTQLSPTAYARFSRNQEVCFHSQKNYNTMWHILPVNGCLKDRMGEVARAGEPIIFEHCATKEYLFCDKIDYRNQFGIEFEVSCKTAAAKAKTQILANENKGALVRENHHKNFDGVNCWCIELSSDPSTAMAVEEPCTQSAAEVMAEIKAALLGRGSMTIRGIGRVFRILDDNRNRQLEVNELLWGLKDFGITLSEA